MFRYFFLIVILGLNCGIVNCSSRFAKAAMPQGTSGVLGRSIKVPLDHKAPRLGKEELYFELGAPYDRTKPVVVIIADGQQFYVRRGAIADLQQSIFGAEFNVVGIVGRGFSPGFTSAAMDPSGRPDWVRAWQIFNSEQWVDDIEAVRMAVVGDRGMIFLYGASGGAYLTHQYLMKYGAHVKRAYTESVVNPVAGSDLGISVDRFWEELRNNDPTLQKMLRKVLDERPADRISILIALQRQHFFVPTDQLAAARAEFIRALDRGDNKYFEEIRKEYQVDEILKLFNSPTGMPISVRELEFIYPSGAFRTLNSETISPYVESEYSFLRPLVALVDSGKIPAPTFDVSPAHRLKTEVFILAARWDEAVDYRSSIALSYSYPEHKLFIANDNHLFERLDASGLRKRLVRAFLKRGLHSTELGAVLSSASAYRWKEE